MTELAVGQRFMKSGFLFRSDFSCVFDRLFRRAVTRGMEGLVRAFDIEDLCRCTVAVWTVHAADDLHRCGIDGSACGIVEGVCDGGVNDFRDDEPVLSDFLDGVELAFEGDGGPVDARWGDAR